MTKNYILIYFAILISLFSCSGQNYKKLNRTQLAMGTTLNIILFTDDVSKGNKIIDQAFLLADKLEKEISVQQESSLVSELNYKKELTFEDKFIFNLIEEAYEYSYKTDGAFDLSLYNIIKLWGFSTDTYRVPLNNEINDGLKKIGYKNVRFDNNKVVLTKNVSLDLGGIAKGKIIDQIAGLLKENGIKDFLINGGGDLYVKGLYDGQRKWNIAVTNPFEKNYILGSVALTDCAIVTSGDYERNFTDDNGKFYHHIIDPKTGYPKTGDIHSVTVISDTAAKADAYSTAFFVMGYEKSIKMADNENNLDVFLVKGNVDNYNIYGSKNFEIIKNNDKWDFIYNINKK